MDIAILSVRNQKALCGLMKEIGVDPAGIEIMAPKGSPYLIRLNKIPAIAANILKQESLSLGSDVAIARGALTGKLKHTDCLLMANFLQLGRLCEKLKIQPYGLASVAEGLKKVLTNYQKEDFILEAGRFRLNLSLRTHIMGVVNMTPDSFSGDGLYKKPETRNQKPDVNNAVEAAEKLVRDGADIIDIGGESSRPGAKPVSVKEELRRIIPVIKALSKRIKVPISVDTYKSEVARRALDNGAGMVNDITALRHDRNMVKLIKKYKAGLVLMHMQDRPHNMQKNPRYVNLLQEIISELDGAIKRAIDYGIKPEKIIIDPGIGFGKTLEHNLEIIRELRQLKILGRPILVGVSRKSFIGKITSQPVENRLLGSISSACLAIANGAHIVRVHDVKETKQALEVLDRIGRC